MNIEYSGYSYWGVWVSAGERKELIVCADRRTVNEVVRCNPGAEAVSLRVYGMKRGSHESQEAK